MSDNSFKDKLITVWGLIKKYAKKTWEYIKVAKMELIVMIALFAIDLISKAVVDANIAQNSTVVLIPNFLNFTYVRNYDAAFGSDWLRVHLGIGARILFCIFAFVASTVFVIILVKNRGGHRLVRVGLAMLVAGAMGNCIDRMALGYVRDFIEFVYFGGTIFGRTSFWIFNIADAALVIGVVLVVIYYVFIYKGKEDKNIVVSDNATAKSADSTDTKIGGGVSEQSENAEDIKDDDTGVNAEGIKDVEKDESAERSEDVKDVEDAEKSENVENVNNVVNDEKDEKDEKGEKAEKGKE